MEDRSPHLPSVPIRALALGAAAGLAVSLGRRHLRTAGDLAGLCAYSVAVTRALPGTDALLAAFRRTGARERASTQPPWEIPGARVAEVTGPTVAEVVAPVAVAAARGSL